MSLFGDTARAWAEASPLQRTGYVLLALAFLLFELWPTYSGWNARGTWQAVLQHEDGSSEPFALRVDAGGGRQGNRGWARFAGGQEQKLTYLDVSRKTIRFDVDRNGQRDQFNGVIAAGHISGTWMPLNGNDDLGDWSAQRTSTDAYAY